MAAVAEVVGEPQPPIHLGGLEGGQRVRCGFHLFVEADQDLGGPADHALQDGGHVLVARLRDRDEGG